MIVKFQQELKGRFRQFILDKYGVELEVVTEYPPHAGLGDLALPLPFALARTVHQPPRKLAEEIVTGIGALPGCARLEVAGGGYINCFFDRREFLLRLYQDITSERKPSSEGGHRVIVEHTNINPNKAAHIGHLRNACLGDSLIRLLRWSGEKVEVQNYIDNTGVQVADVVVGFVYLEGATLEDIKKIPGKFDYHCWDLYSRVTEYYEQDEANLRQRQEVLAHIEEGNNPIAKIAQYIATRIVHCHLATMHRINVQYDLLAWEGDILHLKFWEKAFDMLKSRSAIHLETEGKNKGCWVMNLEESELVSELEEPEKIIVRSDGTVTYVGKDIAYQLWKFGLLGRDFHYRKFHQYPDGSLLWTSTTNGGTDEPPQFGKGERVYNVIDVRQSYLQKIVYQGLRVLGFEEESRHSTHFAYEMVALTPSCCQELELSLSPEERKKPYVEISGRKGRGVKADDLIDKLIDKAKDEVTLRNPEFTPQEVEELSRQIAIGALRYFMVKYSRNKVIPFDFKEALNFEGETGCYIQYAVVRANNILNKLSEREGFQEKDINEFLPGLDFSVLNQPGEGDDLWEILTLLSKLSEVVDMAIQTLEISALAKYCFTLAQKFN
ncbi:MAG: arginine--tRNA ligase, partial [Acidobacteriota bacterium]